MIKIKFSALLSFFIMFLLGCGQSDQYSSSSHQNSPATGSVEKDMANVISEPSAKDIIIYSGNCTKYEKTVVEETKLKYMPIATGFAKIVINNSTKKFSFFFDNNLIFTDDNYLSHIDDQQGGEGFSFSNGFSAHLFTAERMFKIYDGAGSFGSKRSFIGYEYELINYKND